jgi:predicted metal-dependent phosphoesterase TrpH
MERWLKCDFHIHTNKDRGESERIKYSPKKLIDIMSKKKFDVLAISHHEKRYFSKELEDYAKEKNILLIPSIEKTISGKHVLILNVTDDLPEINKLEDLRNISKKSLIIAPHPFYWFAFSLKNDLNKYIRFFDAIEYHSFHFWFMDIFNKRGLRIARKNDKPVVGNSDAHIPHQLGKTYSLVYAEKNIESIFSAIRKNKVEFKTRNLSFLITGIESLMFKFKLNK